jgi:hypothetical protein
LLTVTVRVEVVVAELGLKAALARDGRPLTLKVTAPVKPLLGVIVTTYVTLPPWWLTERLLGDALSEKLGGGGGAVTVSVTDVVWVSAPLVPVMVSGYEPGGVPVVVVTLSVDDVIGWLLGLNVPLAPDGSPLTLRASEALKPPVGVIVTE